MAIARNEAIANGHRFRSELLITWAKQLAKSARKDLKFLSTRGVKEEMLREFERLTKTVEELEIKQEREKKVSKSATVATYEAFEEAHRWWREGKQMIKIEFGDYPDRTAEFRTGTRVGYSLPKLIREAEFMLDAFKRYSENFEWLGGKDFVNRGNELLAKLKDADTEQESTIKQLPKETAELYFNKGELYQLGRKIVRLGRLVFINEPRKASPYNYEILRRSQKATISAATRKTKSQHN